MSESYRAKSFVLKRVNYGEADRILTLLTENGCISAIAKSVRKERSRLAGGIELFCLSDITYVSGKNNSLYTLTSARMLEHYDNITISIAKLELASLVLKHVGRVADSSEGSAYFDLVYQTLRAINTSDRLRLIEIWFLLNFATTGGEEINVLLDTNGKPLAEDLTYVWDIRECALRPQLGGDIGQDAIKVLRFLLAQPLSACLRISDIDVLLPSLLFIAKAINHV